MINKKDISSIPIEGDISFREQKIDKNNTALLIIDLQKGEYNPEIISKISNDGHEIACHYFYHDDVYKENIGKTYGRQ